MSICNTCNDTHRMSLEYGEVMCTHCPTPCQNCRYDGVGAYCTETPCGCNCHAGKADYPDRKPINIFYVTEGVNRHGMSYESVSGTPMAARSYYHDLLDEFLDSVHRGDSRLMISNRKSEDWQ